jgi:hypothetical protein
MDYDKMFRELIYGSSNWVAQLYASRLQQAWCTWKPAEREERLLYGHGSILGLVNLATGYPELKFVYEKYLNNQY